MTNEDTNTQLAEGYLKMLVGKSDSEMKLQLGPLLGGRFRCSSDNITKEGLLRRALLPAALQGS